MSKRRFILNADDFGMSKAFNEAVLEGYSGGLLKSASLVANGLAFEDAINDIIPTCPELGIGVHLNIIEGQSLCEGLKTLTDENGNFNNSYIQLLFKSLCTNNKLFLEEIEKEFRAQIEKIKTKTTITHLDSHVHVHSIPAIFRIVCSLAKEYGIKQVRTQYEKPYMVPDFFRHFNKTYPINLIKVALLNFLSVINESTVQKYNLKTNDYLIGVAYTSIMDSLTVAYGIKAIKYEKVTVEALIHPCRYEDGTIDNHFTELQITKNEKLKSMLNRLGYEVTNYRENE